MDNRLFIIDNLFILNSFFIFIINPPQVLNNQHFALYRVRTLRTLGAKDWNIWCGDHMFWCGLQEDYPLCR